MRLDVQRWKGPEGLGRGFRYPLTCFPRETKYKDILSMNWTVNSESNSQFSFQQEFGSVQELNIAYVGPPHPVLNSYLLLFPMLGAQIKFKCCCKV